MLYMHGIYYPNKDINMDLYIETLQANVCFLDRQEEHLHLKLIFISLLTLDTKDIYGRYPKRM
jgi:hypothetical protein